MSMTLTITNSKLDMSLISLETRGKDCMVEDNRVVLEVEDRDLRLLLQH